MSYLLDANVLIALVVPEHTHHRAAETWLEGQAEPFITCPVTQGSLVRELVRQGYSSHVAKAFLTEVTADRRHVFWSDDVSYHDVRMDGILGHRQVTDAYLAQLARAHDGRLATFDQGLAALHSDIVELVPTG